MEILAVIVVYYDEDEPDVNLRWKKADRNNSNNSHEQTMENGDKQSGYYYDDSRVLQGRSTSVAALAAHNMPSVAFVLL